MTTYTIETSTAANGSEQQRLLRDGAPVSRWYLTRYEEHEIETQIPRLRAALERAEEHGTLADLAAGVLRGLALGQQRADPEVRATFETLHGGPWSDTDSLDEIPE